MYFRLSKLPICTHNAFTPLLGSLLGSLLGAQFRYETGPPYHTHATNGWHRWGHKRARWWSLGIWALTLLRCSLQWRRGRRGHPRCIHTNGSAPGRSQGCCQTRPPSWVTGRGPQRAAKLAQKVNLFRNRVNVLRNRDNLFSITSQQFPPKVYTTQLHSYAVTQLHKV